MARHAGQFGLPLPTSGYLMNGYLMNGYVMNGDLMTRHRPISGRGEHLTSNKKVEK